MSSNLTAPPNFNLATTAEAVVAEHPEMQERANRVRDTLYLAGQHGVQVKTIDDKSLVAVGNEVGKVIEGIIGRDKYAREVYASLMKARELQMPYSNSTEVEYMRVRALPYKFPKV